MIDYLDKLDDQALDLFARATRLASEAHHTTITPVHLLLLLLTQYESEPFGKIVDDIQSLHGTIVTLSDLLAGVDHDFDRNSGLSAEVKDLLPIAAEEALMDGKRYVSLCHLFLALLRTDLSDRIRVSPARARAKFYVYQSRKSPER